jgi:hypothetical protein
MISTRQRVTTTGPSRFSPSAEEVVRESTSSRRLAFLPQQSLSQCRPALSAACRREPIVVEATHDTPIAELCISCNANMVPYTPVPARQRGMVPREHLAIAECSALPSAELLVEPPSALLRRSKVRAQCRRRICPYFKLCGMFSREAAPWFTCGKSDTRGGGALLSGTQVLLKTSLFAILNPSLTY